ncbi:hypothetical protein EJB05_32125 [Eragrostis curvula]|uniref:Bifunctional inhibitor/plant lipid transfer protein/seed storage helical domain-containing protein n=1 Tax=Eragrostis curvula TaxID=38414 RepID=A0A5J9UGQ4_9POAL|nr:hypothetical protein EJB05_32125 [Eragrostis curvula]
MSRMAIKVFQVLVLSLSFNMFTSHIVWGEKDCTKEKVAVLHFCDGSININGAYVAPTVACRNIVEAEETDMICICRNIAPADEVLISVMKFIQLARDCNKPLPAGTKCGSWIVRPSPPPRA